MDSRITPSVSADDRFITDREVARMIGGSRSWIWQLTKEGRFPTPIKLSERCTRWRLSAVQTWMADPQGWSTSGVWHDPAKKNPSWQAGADVHEEL